MPAKLGFSSQDRTYMRLAIDLAEKGCFTTSPNPNVGCVIVKSGHVIGQGWHKKTGTGHAEVNALSDLSVEQSSGATAYVTLEPCSHFGRTPPCAKRLIEANVSNVVIAMLDPNPLVAGKGVALLEAAGITVKVGLLGDQARELNPGFLTRMEKKRPFVQLKMACSIDGKTALSNGESKWITGSGARADVQTYRAKSCGILSTAQTVITDNARLNVRADQINFDYPIDELNTSIRQPIKVILDGKDKITVEAIKELALADLDAGRAPAIVLIKSKANEAASRESFIKLPNIKIVSARYDNETGFDLIEVMEQCAELQLNTIWVEAGAQLAANLIQQDLVDELIVYMAPKIMGQGAKDLLPIGPFTQMDQTKSLNLLDYRAIGSDIRLTYRLN